ncbi:UNKNOWN [Stylonychia lemnae]|uniref:Uncharacterized protein n=1 Tax=Stylonychia lemnae TaxID=5949 RepID=A0A078BBC9_STYLE|nr:UNKNOWN [Stylonychia lemnae]|eukprot:CDW90562.1 UNKNOWN [Stylonychia lemnae]
MFPIKSYSPHDFIHDSSISVDVSSIMLVLSCFNLIMKKSKNALEQGFCFKYGKIDLKYSNFHFNMKSSVGKLTIIIPFKQQQSNFILRRRILIKYISTKSLKTAGFNIDKLSSSKNFCVQASFNVIKIVDMMLLDAGIEDTMTLELRQKGQKYEVSQSFSSLSYSYTISEDSANNTNRSFIEKQEMVGFKKILEVFYDQTDHFNIIMECSDNTILIEKILFKNNRISLKKTITQRQFEVRQDNIQKIYFDYEYNTVLSLRKSGAVDIFKNGKIIYTKTDEKQINQIRWVSHDQISDLMTLKYHPKEWMSIKRRLVCGSQFTFHNDKLFVTRLNYVRIVDINTSSVIHEAFLNNEVQKILQINGQVYIIVKSQTNVLFLVGAQYELELIPGVEGEFLQAEVNEKALYVITKTALGNKIFRIKGKNSLEYTDFLEEDDVLVNYKAKKSVHDKILLFNFRLGILRTIYIERENIRKVITNQFDRLKDNFRTDEWLAFKNKSKTKIYFQKYDNYIGQMRTYEIDKSTNEIKTLPPLSWLNHPVIHGELIYEINYVGKFTYRKIDHYIQNFPTKIQISDNIFGKKIVCVGNRVGILERTHIVRIFNQPNQNSFLPYIFETQKYQIFAWKRIDGCTVMIDNNFQLTTMSEVTGKIISQHKISKRQLGQKSINVEQIRASSEPHRVIMQDDTYKGQILRLEKNSRLRLYKVVEIVSKSQIQILLTFLMPEYKQQFKFSENFSMMIDQSTYELYSREEYFDESGIYIFEQITHQSHLESNNWKFNLNNSIVSPNLKYYLDFEVKSKKYLIKNSFDGQVFKEIPNSLTDQSKLNQFLYFKWMDDKSIALYHEQGIEKVVDVFNDFYKIYYSIIDINSYYGHNKQIGNGYHLNLQTSNQDEVLKKLHFLKNKFIECQRDQCEFHILMTDFQYSWSDHFTNYLPMLQFSFTHYHWMLSLKVRDDHNLSTIKEITDDDLHLMLLQVFPDGDTFLHLIANRNEILDALYQRISKQSDYLFIKNASGLTPLHLCLDTKNYFAIEIFLKLLSNHPFYQHSFNVVEILPKLIQTELPALKIYLESRIITTQILAQYKRGVIQVDPQKNYKLKLTNIWPRRDEFKEKFFEQGKFQSDIKIMLLDLPRLNIYANELSQELYLKLSRCNSLDVFKISTIQYLIDFQWKLTKKCTIYYLYIPQLINHLIFLVYSNLLIKNEFHSKQYDTGLALLVFILTIQFYFLVNEYRQQLQYQQQSASIISQMEKNLSLIRMDCQLFIVWLVQSYGSPSYIT